MAKWPNRKLWKEKQRHTRELLRKFNDAWARGEVIQISEPKPHENSNRTKQSGTDNTDEGQC